MHPDQYLTLYCIMCEHVLCSYCEKHLHQGCAKRYYSNNAVRKCFDRGLLREYAKSSSAAKPLDQSNEMPACLYIQDFSLWCRYWLSNVKKDVEQCISFFSECTIKLNDIISITHYGNNVLEQRKDYILSKLCNKMQVGKDLLLKIETQLNTPTAADIAKSILDIELQCIKFFMIRSKYSHEVLPTEIRFQDNSVDTIVFTLKCEALKQLEMIDGSHKLLGIFTETVEVNRGSVKGNASTISGRSEFAKITAVFYTDSNETEKTPEPPSICDTPYDYCFREVQFFKIYSGSPTSRKGCIVVANDFYSNSVLKETQMTSNNYAMTKIRYGYNCTVPVTNDEIVFCIRKKDITANCPHLIFTDPLGGYTQRRPGIGIVKGQLAFISHFVNAISLSPELVTNILYRSYRSSSTNKHDRVRLGCIIGDTGTTCGLETVLFHRKATAGQKTESTIISVPRIKLYGNYVSSSTEIYNTRRSFREGKAYECIQDEKGRFRIFWSTNERDFQLAYRSVRDEDTEIDNAIVLHDDHYDKELLVKKAYLNADLLCSMNQGLMFVSRSFELDVIYIGKIIPNEQTVNVCVLVTLHQKSIGVQIAKLTPLAMIETSNNELLVVCSIDGGNDKLAMIWPEKSGSGVLEILEVKYPSTEFSQASIVELQIDPVGNIMYVLENEDGKCCCACTRYFMPKTETADDQ